MEIEKVEEVISSNILNQKNSPTNNLTLQVNFKNSTVIIETIETSTVNQTLISGGSLNLMNLTETIDHYDVSDESNNSNESLHNDSLLLP